ncbi:hypothetical protein E2F46_02770 [Luteimonas aestuarii]|uniref:TonB C-terminal domain-containing protein n=1 Tax=Luteimonas aestuarii TaxID=453837 RepID=A0A4R5U0T5_9GAMM|nr:energy transducer TonB [Luteimonas aestuarii]TDK27154.1 hypothetical protein E2F46_02770 [Luteimonas aestuarii]
MRKLAWVALLLVFAAGTSFAQSPAAARKLIEHSMVVTGHVLIEPDGSASGLELDQPEKLPAVVTRMVEGAVPGWRFEPVLVDGEPRKVKARMSLRLVANMLENGDYRISMRSGYFGKDALSPDERGAVERSSILAVAKQTRISYPMQAARVGAQGTVYVTVRVGRDGSVLDAVAEQVNLRTRGTPRQMESMRNMLARSAVSGVREWTYAPPTSGDLVGEESWSGRVTVDFTLDGEGRPEYGQWHAYIPGPRAIAPWLVDDLGAHGSPDLADPDGLHLVGQGLKLLTPLQES